MRILFIILSVMTISCSTFRPKGNILSTTQFATVITQDIVSYCAVAIVESCGLTLTKCSNGFTYLCATNVFIFDMAEYNKAAGITN